MRRGYNKEVRVEAIAKRLKGDAWEDIQEHISAKYAVKPSIRQMQKWVEEYQSGNKDPTGVRSIAKEMEDLVNQARMLAEAASGPTGPQAVEFPSWVASQKESGLDIRTAIIASLRLLESQVGRNNFDDALKYYFGQRSELDQFSNWFSGPEGPSGPTGPHGPMDPTH